MSKRGVSPKNIGRRTVLVPCQPSKEKMGSGCGRLQGGRRLGRLFFSKHSSAHEQPLRTRWFYVGFAYASTAFGRVFVMRDSDAGHHQRVYSISMVLLLTAVGVATVRGIVELL